MSLLKRAILRSMARVADAGLEGYARSRKQEQGEGASAGGEEDPGDCLPCKAIERRKQAQQRAGTLQE